MQVIELPDSGIRPLALGFSPDGRRLAAWDDQNALVLDLSAGTVRSFWHQERGLHRLRNHRNPAVGFTADGNGLIALRLNYQSYPGITAELCACDAATGKIRRTRPVSPTARVEIGPGSGWVFFTDWVRLKVGIGRWNPVNGRSLPGFGWSQRDLDPIAVSADERTVAATIWDAVRVLKFHGEAPPQRATRLLKSDSRHWQTGLAVSADGAFVAASGIRYTGARVNGWRVEAWAADTGKRFKVASGTTGYPDGRNLSFHPAKPLLAYCAGSDEVAFWDAASRTEVRRFAWGVGDVNTVAFSADGLRCAAGAAGKVVVWDVD